MKYSGTETVDGVLAQLKDAELPPYFTIAHIQNKVQGTDSQGKRILIGLALDRLGYVQLPVKWQGLCVRVWHFGETFDRNEARRALSSYAL